MAGKHAAPEAATGTPPTGAPTRLRDLKLAGTYSTGDHALTEFYIPALAASYRYDRMAGYYSSAVLKVAARGIIPFLRNAAAHGGGMRLIVGTQLSPQDVAAVRAGTTGWAEALTTAAQQSDITLTGDPIGDEYLKSLGWMVHEGLLQIKVGVPVDDDGHPLGPDEARGYFHSKFGILTDPTGDKVAFIGSENETATGWLYNHETFSVAKSWLPEVWAEQGTGIEERFQRHWDGHPDSGWVVLDLADVDDRLLKLVPPDYAPPEHDPIWELLNPPKPEPTPDLDAARAELIALQDAPTRSRWTAVGTAPAIPLPHQAHLIEQVVETYPRGYLFADEVGLGKTIEAGLAIRELILSGTARSALLLVPATVMKQWQEELFEKIGLDVPRYVGTGFLDRNDQPVPWGGGNPWNAFPIVLASSHLARRRARRQEILTAAPWDIVLVDEAHHARRRGSKPTDTPNALLNLLLAMRSQQAWRALYLASATPMQMHAHEAWDLISLLELPGLWGQSAQDFINYFENLRSDPGFRTWGTLTRMLKDYFSDPMATRDTALEAEAKAELGLVNSRKITRLHDRAMAPETVKHLTPLEIEYLDRWLRRHTPMKDRVFRNTRQTLRDYQAAGLLPADVVIPHRHVHDEFIPLGDHEQQLYDRIERYIRRHYNAYKTNATTQALGFIMTIYRRRLTSSFHAIRESLRKRLDVLENGRALAELLTADDTFDVEDNTLFDPEDFDLSAELLKGEITELRAFLADLEKITGEDTKATHLTHGLARAFDDYTTVVVFTQYTDTMDYVRERVTAAGHTRVGCYSGRGGELYNPTTHAWDPVTKAEIKERFRTEQITVLIGTDSMSEGLNLQTCGRLINYDMPWNLMRVEQRIGRVDRIGARYPDIHVTNYFYAGTVEQRVYDGIKADYGDFTDIVGNAQPVLAAVEDAIEKQAMGEDDIDLDTQITNLRTAAAEIQNRAVKPADMGGPTIMEAVPTLIGDITLDDLRTKLTTNALTAPHLTAVDDRDGTYNLIVNGDACRVTFDRRTADTATDGTLLLSYGSRQFDALLAISLTT